MEIEQPANLTNTQRRLHRWTALLVLPGCAIGWLMVVIPLRDLLVKFALYQLHQTLGIIIFVLFFGLVFLRFTHRRPYWNKAIAPWKQQTLSAARASIFVLLAVVAIFGYVTATAAPGHPRLHLV